MWSSGKWSPWVWEKISHKRIKLESHTIWQMKALKKSFLMVIWFFIFYFFLFMKYWKQKWRFFHEHECTYSFDIFNKHCSLLNEHGCFWAPLVNPKPQTPLVCLARSHTWIAGGSGSPFADKQSMTSDPESEEVTK